MIYKAKILFCILVLLVSIPTFGTAATQEESIKAAIIKYVVSKNTAWSKSKILVNYRMNQKVSERLKTYGADALFNVPEIYPNSNITSSMILPIQVLENGVERERIFLQVEIQVFQNVVVAQNKFVEGEAIKKKGLKTEVNDILKIRGDFYVSMDALSGKEAKRLIKKGTVIVKSMIEQIPVVAKNEQIKIVVKESGIRVEASGVALEDGLAGEKIKVKRLNGKKIIEAKVISSGIVEVEI